MTSLCVCVCVHIHIYIYIYKFIVCYYFQFCICHFPSNIYDELVYSIYLPIYIPSLCNCQSTSFLSASACVCVCVCEWLACIDNWGMDVYVHVATHTHINIHTHTHTHVHTQTQTVHTMPDTVGLSVFGFNISPSVVRCPSRASFNMSAVQLMLGSG